MIFALEFSDSVDPTALATVLLALLTFATVVVGAVALHRARREIDLSRQEVEEAHRPVLIPVFDDEGLHAEQLQTPHREKPRYRENNRVVLPIKNIGMGPALKITVFIGPGDGGELPKRDEVKWHSASFVGLRASEMVPVTVQIPGLTELPSFALVLSYLDVAGKIWKTSAEYINRGDGLYAGMSIEAISPAMSAKRWLLQRPLVRESVS